MRASIPLLVVTAQVLTACPVDLPRVGEQRFACHAQEECVAGFQCVGGECVAADQDAGMTDSGTTDSGTTDSGTTDSGTTDSGAADAGVGDAAAVDSAGPLDWMNRSWGQRVALYFDNSASTTELVDLPVLVQLAASDFDLTSVAAGGADLRFTPSGSQDLLAYEVVRADATTLEVWVRVPSIPAGSTDSHIWLYFDNPGAPLRDNPAAVWSNGYAGVWHLEQEPVGGGAVLDSLGAHHGTAAGNMQPEDLVRGQVGGALDFDGSDDTIDVGDLGTDSWTGLTLEAWFNQGGVGQDPRLICEATGTSGTEHTFCLLAMGGSMIARINTDDSGYSEIRSTRSMSTGTWVHGAMTWSADSARLELYTNGVSDNGQQKSGTTLRDSPQHVHLANNNASDSRWYDGLMDEVRISSVARSADWISAQHLTTTGAFVRVGSVEQRP